MSDSWHYPDVGIFVTSLHHLTRSTLPCHVLQILCASADQAIELMHKGSRSRQQASTGVNATSSRSHCVFTVGVVVVATRHTAI